MEYVHLWAGRAESGSGGGLKGARHSVALIRGTQKWASRRPLPIVRSLRQWIAIAGRFAFS